MIYTVTLNTAIDRVFHISGQLRRKHNNRITQESYDIGGKATHVSVVLSSLNIPNIATGFIGTTNKRILLDLLQDKGVSCDFIEQEGSAIRESLVLIDESGLGSYMITEKGFEIRVQTYRNLLEKLTNSVQAGDLVVLAGSPPAGISVEKYNEILKAVKVQNGRVIVDAAGDFLKAAVTMQPTLIKPNEFEFEELVGKPLTSLIDYAREILLVLEQGVEYVIVSLGKEGSLVGHGREVLQVIPPRVKEVNDTGCGDVFVGGLTAKLYENCSLEEMIIFATALGASKATQQNSSDFSLEQAKALEKEVTIKRIWSDDHVVL